MDFKIRWALNDEMLDRLRKDFGPLLPDNRMMTFPLGWENVIRTVLEEFAGHKNDLNVLQIEQIKDKFGDLRIYTNFSSDKIQDTIRRAEALAGHTCMECGTFNESVTKGPRFQILCQQCLTKAKEMRPDDYDE